MSKQHALALNTVVEGFTVAEEARKPFEKKWNKYYRMSESIPEKMTARTWRTNRFIPYTSAIIDLVIPRYAAKRPAAQVVGINEKSAIKQDKFNKLIDYQQDLLNIDTLFLDWITDAARYGTSFLKVGWKKETAKNHKRTKGMLEKILAFMRKIAGNEVKIDTLLYDNPVSETVDIFDIFVHPKAKNRDNADYIIQRMELTKHQLLGMPGVNVSMVEGLEISNSEVDKFRKERLASKGLTSGQISKISRHMSDSYFEVLEYWGLFDINGDGNDEECVITVVDRQHVVRIEENPFYHGKKPFIVLKFKTDPNFFYGKGICETIESLQDELNDIGNQASDMRKLTLLPMIKVKNNANMDVEKIKIAPGAPFVVEDPNDITFERPPDFTQQLEFMSRSSRELMQVATGANDIVLGQGDVGIASDTATGAAIATEQTALRFRVPALLLDSAIEDWGLMLISLNQQFFDRKRKLPNISGDFTFEEILPLDLNGQFSYKVSTTSMIPTSSLARRTELINLKSLFIDNPRIDQEKLDRMIIQLFNVEPDSIMKPEMDRMTALNEFNRLSPEQKQAATAGLDEEDRQLLLKASGGISNAREPREPVPTDATGGSVEGLVGETAQVEA